MQFRNRALQLMIVFLLSLGVVVENGLLRGATAQSQLPSEVQPCIPSQQVARAEMVGSASVGGSLYYLLAAYELNDPQSSDLVISVSANQCEVVLYNPMGDFISLSSVLGEEVGRQLTLERYKAIISDVGKDAFQQEVNQSAAAVQGDVEWFAEGVWALEQLGIEVPSNVIPLAE